ncbi:hypothetical protein [Streptomyces sp. TRM68416]|uniref:hypothetical protein n=1 Tax=Streptomyces sp. TRM68416 TaxID=2758412 RepID=UPI001661AEE8|nr:hypothetical protein [Streptomyces sp. TRM68416]MBD0843980.1 hypothetical protein [Streptomyces sp. TRM68416]
MTVKNDSKKVQPGGGPVHRRSFLGGSVAAAVAAVSIGATQASAADRKAAPTAAAGGTSASGLRAGAGKAVIEIPSSLLPLDGFTTVHDDLYVRILLLESGSRRVALVVLDMTSIGSDGVAALRKIVTDAAGVESADIIVTVTHTFSTPHVNPGSAANSPFMKQVSQAASTAVAAAVKALQPALVGFGTGKCDVNVNRDVLTADGWWLGTGESGTSDKSVGVTRFDDTAGNPIAILVNYAVQSSVMLDSVMANGDHPVTADLAGAAVAHIEKQYGDDTVGFFLVGACGDQSPAFRSKRYTIDKDKKWSQTDAADAGWLLLTVQGERLGTEAVRVSQTVKTTAAATLDLVTDSVTVDAVTMGRPTGPVKTYTFTPNGTADVPIWVLRIGAGVFAGVAPELSASTGLSIKKRSPFPHTAVLSMLDGGAKSMADSISYARITYEAVNSTYAQGSAEKVAAKIDDMLDSLRG